MLAGSGELHIEVCINDLRAYAQCEIIVSNPVVTYKETITASVEEQRLTKSTNKHNRIYANVAPLDDGLVQAIEDGKFDTKADPKTRA